MEPKLSNWNRNIKVFKIDSFINWFFVPIGVYILIWNQDLQLSFSQINTAISIGLLWSVILELPSGALADLIGRKKTIVMGRFLIVFAYVLFALQHNWFGVLLHQLFYYTDHAFSSGAQSALLYDSLKENSIEKSAYKRVESDTYMLNTLGMATASILSGYLYTIDPFLPFLVMIPITAFGAVVSTFYEEPLIDTEKYSLRSYIVQNKEGIKHLLRNEQVKWVSIYTIIVLVIMYVSLWYLYEPRLTAAFEDPKAIAWLIGGTYIIRAFGTRLTRITGRINSETVVPIFLVLFQTVGSLLSFISTGFGAVSSVYLRKFSDGYLRPTVLAMQNEEIESKYRATSLSALSLGQNLILAVLGIIVGVGIDGLGEANTLGLVGVVGFAVAMPVAVKLIRVKKTSSIMK